MRRPPATTPVPRPRGLWAWSFSFRVAGKEIHCALCCFLLPTKDHMKNLFLKSAAGFLSLLTFLRFLKLSSRPIPGGFYNWPFLDASLFLYLVTGLDGFSEARISFRSVKGFSLPRSEGCFSRCVSKRERSDAQTPSPLSSLLPRPSPRTRPMEFRPLASPVPSPVLLAVFLHS